MAAIRGASWREFSLFAVIGQPTIANTAPKEKGRRVNGGLKYY